MRAPPMWRVKRQEKWLQKRTLELAFCLLNYQAHGTPSARHSRFFRGIRRGKEIVFAMEAVESITDATGSHVTIVGSLVARSNYVAGTTTQKLMLAAYLIACLPASSICVLLIAFSNQVRS